MGGTTTGQARRRWSSGGDVSRSNAVTSASSFVIVLIAAAAALLYSLSHAGDTDPTLGSHMGTDAPAFPLQMAHMVLFVAPWILVGLWLARRHAIGLLGVAAGAIVLQSSVFFLFGIGCGGQREDLFALFSTLLFVSATAMVGYLIGSSGAGRTAAMGAVFVLVSAFVLLAAPQTWGCGPSSQQAAGRDLEVALLTIPFGALCLLVAVVAWAVGERRSARRNGMR